MVNNVLNKDVVIIDPVSDERWDKFVEDHPLGWITHLSGWKRVLEKSFNHMKGYYLVVLDKDNIRSALPVYEVKSWLMGNKLVSVPFATLCTPLVSERNDLKVLLGAVKRLATELEIPSVEIRMFNSRTLIDDDSFGIDRNYKHHYLLLNIPPEDLKKKFSRSSIRQRISRAYKSNLILKKGLDVSDLNAFYQLHLISRKQKGLPVHPYKFIKTLWEEFSSSQKVILLLAKHKEQTIAGVMLFQYKDRLSAEYAVFDYKYKKLSPIHFLFWESIKLAYEEGMKIFDFGRTSSTNVGLMDFKRHWGTEIVDFPQFFYPKETVIESILVEQQWKYCMMKKICKQSPLFIQEMIGNFCYRHLS